MSDAPLLLSIDLGTTACEALVVSSEGEILGKASRDYPLVRHGSREVEQHAQDWWRVASICARSAIAESRHPGRSILAVSVSSQGTSIVPVDGSGHPLRPAISWLDTRARSECEAITEQIGQAELFSITGKRPRPSHSLPKILWIRRNEPEIFERTARFLIPHDYLIYRLTGCFTTDQSLASSTLAHDVTRLEWSSRLLGLADAGVDRMSDIAWAGTPVCAIIAESAETIGVSREAVVVCGGQNRKCASLGAGAKLGVVTVSLGTTSAITAVVPEPVLDSQMRLLCFPFVLPGTWVLQGELTSAGGALKWLKETFFSGQYSLLDDIAEPSFANTAGLFFFPHLAGASSPAWDPDLPGVLYGITMSTTTGGVARAVLEGVAYQIRSNIETMLELGVTVDAVKVFGGGARSEVWLQIISEVLGRDILVPPSTEAGAVGACVLAGVGAGVYASAEDGVRTFLRGEQVISPDRERAREYDDRYFRYKEIERRLGGKH